MKCDECIWYQIDTDADEPDCTYPKGCITEGN
jgi:hypothetical protein